MSSRGKAIEKPPVNEALTYGAVVDFRFRPSVTKQRGKYCIRFHLVFENGKSRDMQTGGFPSKAAAERAKESVVTALSIHRYVPFRFTVKEFYDYWLFYYMIDDVKIAYNTFCTYRNIIYNYILKQWGEKKQMEEISREDLKSLLDSFPTKALFTSGKTVLKSSFKYALEKNIVSTDTVSMAVKAAASERKKEENWKKITNREEEGRDGYRIFTAEQAAYILYTAKENEPLLYMPLLFTITAGTRISEALGVRYSDVDFTKKMLNVKCQIGRSMDDAGLDTDELTKQAINPKTENGVRTIPLPDFVLDEVVLARQRYELLQKCIPGFKDYGYVCCQDNGKPHNRSNLYKRYRRVLEACGFKYIVWHGLRHTYASLLASGDISMKAISECMGHFAAGFTKKVYVTQQKTVYDGAKEAEAFWQEVKPEEEGVLETGAEESLETYVMDIV